MARAKGSPKVEGSGRTKGTPNKRTQNAIDFAQNFLKDRDFQDAIRNIMANPHHEHWQWTVELMMNYAYGKPREHIHQTSDGTLPAHQLNIAWVSYDQFWGDDPNALPAQAKELPVAHHAGGAGGEEHLGRHPSQGW